eukprot:TRINITY_DN853_c0_g1_i1.p1 TRINITY_DN853_c0_g1~~TRINITY_DN853_c0_g1_i1.p1  ORF type:complete len:154 (+),score=25.67 TRINITY_DN853_c0_g1_i1:53-514(+)
MDIEDVRGLGQYDTIAFKTGTAALSGFLLGNISGAVAATWQNVPAVERNQAWPALQKTGRVMSSYGLYFAAIGTVFAATDAIAQEVRGKKDIWNGFLGGLAAGSVVGLRTGSVPMAVGASAAFAAMSVIVDASGQVTKIDTGREYIPLPVDRR